MLEGEELTVMKIMFSLALSALFGPPLAWLVMGVGGN